jgi:hypothetical protein
LEVEVELIVGGVAPTQFVTLYKTGSTPTTFDVMTIGDIIVEPTGWGHAFVAGNQTRVFSIDPVSTAVSGLIAGVVMIDNTDLTSAGLGDGVADGDDEIAYTARVLDHSEASFLGGSDSDSLVINLGTVPFQSGLRIADFEVFNLELTPGLTAALNLTALQSSGDDETGVLYADIQPFVELPAGSSNPFTATIDSTRLSGSFETTYVLQVADANMPGGQAGSSLELTLTGTVLPAVACSQPSDCGTSDPCVTAACVANICSFSTRAYGDVNDDESVDLLDILCALDGFFGQFHGCQFESLDVAPCGGDGDLDLADILGVLDAYRGIDACCSDD